MSEPHHRVPLSRERRVLVVDSHTPTAESYRAWLLLGGHDTSVAGDATRAVMLAPLLRPDVVVIDLERAGADAFNLLTKLRSLLQLPRPRFVAVSAEASSKRQSHCLAMGFELLLERPATSAPLLEAVRALATRPQLGGA